MTSLKEKEQAAMDAVAKHFSATWEKADDDWPDAYLMIARKRIAIEVTAIKRRIAEPDSSTKPRLRFDKEVLRLVGGLQTALHQVVPNGQAVIVTVTAPIRLGSKTTAALEENIRAWLARLSLSAEIRQTIYGNQIRVKFVKGVATRGSNVIGFVHNPDSNPDVLFDLTESLLNHVGAAGSRAPRKFAGNRWLVLANEDGFPHIDTYRHIYSQLSIPSDFERILIVLPGGRVESLAG